MALLSSPSYLMVMMKDKVCVVTGANTGIGFEIALGLAKQEAHVVLVCRDIHKGNDAKDKIEEVCPDASVYLVLGDLSSNDKTRALADKIIQEYKKVHVLVHNAGIWPSTLKVNEEELEEAFCVNHLSPFYLTHLLMDNLKAGAPSRVLFMNDALYAKATPLDLAKTPYGINFSQYSTYRQTKLCSTLCLRKWDELFSGSQVSINMVHPGNVNTQLGNSNDWLGWVVRQLKKRWKTPEQGAEAPLWLAISEQLANTSGVYFNEKTKMELPEIAMNEGMQNEIWALSLRLCKLHAEQQAAVPEGKLLDL